MWSTVRDTGLEDGVSGRESIELLPRLPRETRIPRFHVATPKNPIYWAHPPPSIHPFGASRGTILPLDERTTEKTELRYKDSSELKRDSAKSGGRREVRGQRGGGETRGEGKGWRATRGPSTMDRLGDSEMSRPTTLNGRRMRTLPQLDRRTMHPGRRMLTLAITWFNAGIDGFSSLLSVPEPVIVVPLSLNID